MLDRVLSCTHLPTFPSIATELLQITRDPEVSISDIAKLIKTDQGLASRVLKTVNSSFYGLSQPCTTLERALGFLGLKAVKALVLGFSVVKVTEGMTTHSGFDMEAYWRRTIAAATGARQIALTTRACDPDEAFTAGLFQDMGMLACFVSIRDAYLSVLQSAPRSHSQLSDHEQTSLGFTHAQVGAELASKWRMAESVVACVRHHHDPHRAEPAFRDMVKVVALGRMAAEVMSAKQPAQPLADLMMSAHEWFKQNNESVESLLDKIATAADELAQILDQRVGDLPDAATILAMANEQLVQQQLEAQRETAQLQKKADTLHAQTVTDALTGAANRMRFDQEILRQFDAAATKKKPIAVLFVDADKFKSVNDTHGHQAGDAVLVELAKRMGHIVDQLGTVCRYGGEEFAIILPQCTQDKATRIAELLRQTIAGQPFDLSGVDGAPPSIPVTASVGVAATDPARPGLYPSAQQLVLAADKAVYTAKHAGRNCVKVWVGDPESTPETHAPPAAPGPQAPPPGDATPNPVRVLLIERDPLAAKLLRDEFSLHPSVQFNWVSSAPQTIEHLKLAVHNPQLRPTVILCDVDLPQGKIQEMIQACQKIIPENQARVFMLAADTQNTSPPIVGTQLVAKAQIADDPAAWVKSIVTTSGQAIRAA